MILSKHCLTASKKSSYGASNNLPDLDNEITKLHPAITRWLNSKKSIQNIYNNKQSVHDHNIEHTTNDSIKNFIKLSIHLFSI